MAEALNQIKEPIKEELKLFENHFRNSMKSHVALLDKITYYIVKRKGKQVRPMFVFLMAKTFGPVSEATYVAASLVELLHTATLVHDDVVDDSMQRRGYFSINALWKNKIAVLVGDYLLSRGLLLALENDQFQVLQIVSRAVKEMSEGELLQIEKARKLDIEEDIYFDIIRQKTASLIAAACAAGVASTSSNIDEIESARKFGEHIGIAFQLKDDLFDFGEEDVGKPLGIDIKEKKLTLPIIYLLKNSDRITKRKIINTIRKHHKDNEKVKELIAMVRSSGGIEYATEKMIEHREKAMKLLEKFPNNRCKEALSALIKYVTERSN